MFDVSNGGWSSMLRVDPGCSLATHYHTQPVNGYTLQGSWRYLEHDWVARAGTLIFEPPGELHTLVADPDEGMASVLRHARVARSTPTAEGEAVGYEDGHAPRALPQPFRGGRLRRRRDRRR